MNVAHKRNTNFQFRNVFSAEDKKAPQTNNRVHAFPDFTVFFSCNARTCIADARRKMLMTKRGNSRYMYVHTFVTFFPPKLALSPFGFSLFLTGRRAHSATGRISADAAASFLYCRDISYNNKRGRGERRGTFTCERRLRCTRRASQQVQRRDASLRDIIVGFAASASRPRDGSLSIVSLSREQCRVAGINTQNETRVR